MAYSVDPLNKETYDTRMGRYRSHIQHEFIVKNASNKFNNILDICGGSGRIVIPLVKNAGSITVVDINAEALQALKERNLGISTVCGDFSKIEFKDKYSLVLCVEGPDYFKDLPAFFSKAESLMTPDGKLIFTYTNPNSWRYFIKKLKHIRKPITSLHVIKYKELQTILNTLGLKINDCHGFYWMPLPIFSNSKLVPLFQFTEKVFNLSRWFSQSPWLMVSVIKKENN
jgi:ubiquinone/menaquinone biosynthesis C-methylase UbiE